MNETVFLARLAEELLSEAERLAAVRSHIYAYRPIGGGRFEPISSEAVVVSNVIGQLADIPFLSCGRILELISNEYREASPQIRNRSGRLWTPKTLAALVKPIYAGTEPNAMGILVKVDNFPELVSITKYRKAISRLRKENLAE